MAKAIEEYTEFQKYVKAKFNIPSTDKADYLFLFNAPEQYEVEPLMLEYVKNHEDATVEELLSYFDNIAPPAYLPALLNGKMTRTKNEAEL